MCELLAARANPKKAAEVQRYFKETVAAFGIPLPDVRLVAMDLIAKGQIERFFVLLSGVLREYIESSFQVRAPERTTEEFLQEASRDPALDVHRSRLAEFLSLCDQVKFARFEPEAEAIQGAFDVTKRFIEETKSREPAHL